MSPSYEQIIYHTLYASQINLLSFAFPLGCPIYSCQGTEKIVAVKSVQLILDKNDFQQTLHTPPIFEI